jgi:hypothetical protein
MAANMKRNRRIPTNLSLTDTTRERLETLADQDHRDMSHELDAPVEAEWKRRNPAAQKAA